MKMAICLKQVPDTETKIKLTDPIESNNSIQQHQNIDFQDIKWILNPYDEYGIEATLQLKSKVSGSFVTAMSLGPKSRVTESLRTALAMGVDDAVCIDTPEEQYGLMDSLTVAKLLAKCLEKRGPFDLIFVGRSAIDDNQSAVGPMLASLLDIPHASVVSKLDLQGDCVLVERDVEGGVKEVIEMKLPALIGASKGLNTPRYATLPGILKAKKKPIVEITPHELGIDSCESMVSYSHFQLPPERPNVKILEGTVTEQATELVRLLKYEEKIF